jgi:hypothetical protein
VRLASKGSYSMPLPSNTALTLKDVRAHIGDKALAAEAFVTLMQLQEQGRIDIYLPAGWAIAGHRRFNVWDNSIQERMTLAYWLREWLAERQAPQEGGTE